MKRVYVNEEWCLGCHLCEYHCAFAATGEEDMASALKDVVIRPRIRVEDGDGVHFAVSCRHCEEPYCVKGCIAVCSGEKWPYVADKSVYEHSIWKDR